MASKNPPNVQEAVPAVAIVEEVKYRSGEAGRWYRTELTFADVRGGTVRTKVNLGQSHSPGQRVNIVHDPQSPKRVMLATEVGRWNPDGGRLAFGARWALILIFLIPGIFLLIVPLGDPICTHPTFRDMELCHITRA